MVDALLARAEELVRKKWIRGKLVEPETGRVCLAGAVCQAGIEAEAGPEVVEAYRAVADAIVHVGGSGLNDAIGTIMAWNDAPGRRQEEVVEAVVLARRLSRDGPRTGPMAPNSWFRRTRPARRAANQRVIHTRSVPPGAISR